MSFPTIIICTLGCGRVFAGHSDEPWLALHSHDCVSVSSDPRCKHGTEWGYIRYTCRCGECCDAHNAAEVRRRENRKTRRLAYAGSQP